MTECYSVSVSVFRRFLNRLRRARVVNLSIEASSSSSSAVMNSYELVVDGDFFQVGNGRRAGVQAVPV